MEKVVETNLEKIKETAIAFLYLKPEFNKDYPFIVIPPFYWKQSISYTEWEGEL